MPATIVESDSRRYGGPSHDATPRDPVTLKRVHRQEYVCRNPSGNHSSQMYRRRKSGNHGFVPFPDKPHQTHKPTQNPSVCKHRLVFLSMPIPELLYLVDQNALHPQTIPISFYLDTVLASLRPLLATFFLNSAWACGSA